MYVAHAVSVILVSALGVLACKTAPKQDGAAVEQPKQDTGAASSAAPDERDLKIYGWKNGEQYDYRFEMSSRVALDNGGHTLSDFDMQGTVRITPLQVHETKAEFIAAFAVAKVVSRVPGTQAKFERLGEDLKRPCLFTMSGGIVTQYDLAGDTVPIAAGVIRTVLASLQFARAKRTSSTFFTSEFDTTGQYIARYTPQAARNLWHKEKQRYVNILLPKEAAAADSRMIPDIAHSLSKFTLDERGRIVAVSLVDEVLLKGAQAPLTGSTRLDITGTAVSATTVSGPEELRKGLIRLAANEPFDSLVTREALDEAKINGTTFDGLLRQFEQAARERQIASSRQGGAPNAPNASEDESRSFIALSAHLRREPKTVQQATERIISRSPASDTLVDALGSADTVHAQQSLAAIASDKKADGLLRSRALIALSRVEHPSAQSVAALTTLLGDAEFRTQALYGLGTYCRLLREAGEPQQSEAIGRLLTEQLLRAKTSTQKSESLRALANSGYAAAFEMVIPYLSDATEQLRVDAVRSLRLIETPAADRVIAKTLTDDESRDVRLAAIESMRERRPTDVMVGALRKSTADANAHVRYRAVQLVIRWLTARPDLRASIEIVAKNDEEPKLRELAATAL